MYERPPCICAIRMSYILSGPCWRARPTRGRASGSSFPPPGCNLSSQLSPWSRDAKGPPGGIVQPAQSHLPPVSRPCCARHRTLYGAEVSDHCEYDWPSGLLTSTLAVAPPVQVRYDDHQGFSFNFSAALLEGYTIRAQASSASYPLAWCSEAVSQSCVRHSRALRAPHAAAVPVASATLTTVDKIGTSRIQCHDAAGGPWHCVKRDSHQSTDAHALRCLIKTLARWPV